MNHSETLTINSKDWFDCIYADNSDTAYNQMIYKKKETFKNSLRNVGRSSIAARTLFELIDFELMKLGISSIYEDKYGHKEWRIKDPERDRVYAYDFVIRDRKIIIEFNGEHVHPRKDKLSKDDWNSWRSLFTGQSADEVYLFDTQKNDCVKNKGYSILVLWNQDGQNYNFNKAMAWLSEKINDVSLIKDTKRMKTTKWKLIYPSGTFEIFKNLKQKRKLLGISEHYSTLMKQGRTVNGMRLERMDKND